MAASGLRQDGPVTPIGLNHLVINVRDIEESHRFWTELIGLKQVGESKGRAERPGAMRFYSGDHGGGRMHHHDIALMENPGLPAPAPDGTARTAIGHIAIALPDRDAWLAQLAFMQRQGVRFERRVEHGMTHSVYIRDPNGYSVELLYELPREVWAGDINAALNHYRALPTEGPGALEDTAAGVPVFGPAASG